MSHLSVQTSSYSPSSQRLQANGQRRLRPEAEREEEPAHEVFALQETKAAMSPVSFDAVIQTAPGCPCPVSPGGRRVQLRPLQLEGRQLGGAGASLEEPLQEEEQARGTETGEEEEKEGDGSPESGQVQRRRLTKPTDP